jgi:hypothetical protein
MEWLNFIATEVPQAIRADVVSDDARRDEGSAESKARDVASTTSPRTLRKQPYLTGDTFTIADAYLFTVVNWSGTLGIDLAAGPRCSSSRRASPRGRACKRQCRKKASSRILPRKPAHPRRLDRIHGAASRDFMNRLPTLFLSHGSPLNAAARTASSDAWAALGRTLPRPRAVLIASAHWETAVPMLTGSEKPETIHDFGGFPEELYKIRYPASGSPKLAQEAVSLMKDAGITAGVNGCRGIDHGAWVPCAGCIRRRTCPWCSFRCSPSSEPHTTSSWGARSRRWQTMECSSSAPDTRRTICATG